jgi:hypothetical protein
MLELRYIAALNITQRRIWLPKKQLLLCSGHRTYIYIYIEREREREREREMLAMVIELLGPLQQALAHD